MTKEEIINMAREIGLKFRENNNEIYSPDCDGVHMDEMERFAKLVELRYQKKIADLELIIGQRYYDVLQEREACAKVCDEFWLNGRYLTDVADSIRARGQQ